MATVVIRTIAAMTQIGRSRRGIDCMGWSSFPCGLGKQDNDLEASEGKKVERVDIGVDATFGARLNYVTLLRLRCLLTSFQCFGPSGW
jgi:hypothetical protein